MISAVQDGAGLTGHMAEDNAVFHLVSPPFTLLTPPQGNSRQIVKFRTWH